MTQQQRRGHCGFASLTSHETSLNTTAATAPAPEHVRGFVLHRTGNATPTISVVINTLNEERNVALAIRSVMSWATEVVVVDMHSDDGTRRVAEQLGAIVHLHPRMGFVEPAREFAIAQSTGDWILILDADEVISLPLAQRLIEICTRDEADIVTIPRLNFIMGKALNHCGWGPEQDRQTRFFRRGSLRQSDNIHGAAVSTAQSRWLNLAYSPHVAITHFNYLSASHFLEKLNRYTTVEAEQAFDRGEKSSVARAFRKALGEFRRRYVQLRGYRDGWRGLYLCLMMATYRWMVMCKLQELREEGREADIRERYSQLAEELIAAYPSRARVSGRGGSTVSQRQHVMRAGERRHDRRREARGA